MVQIKSQVEGEEVRAEVTIEGEENEGVKVFMEMLAIAAEMIDYIIGKKHGGKALTDEQLESEIEKLFIILKKSIVSRHREISEMKAACAKEGEIQ